MREILSLTRKAVDEYGMIREGDRVAVGVSGGKDSVLMLRALADLRRFYPNRFDLVAITADPQFGGVATDYTPIEDLCRQLEVPYVVNRTDIGQIVFDVRKEPNPCSLCARLRRGALHDMCNQLGCNKLALAHHYDDAAETFLMNLIHEGRVGCFSPVTYLSRKDITMIRPFCLLPETKIKSAVKRLDIPVVKSVCPADGATAREDTKELLLELNRRYHGIKDRIVGAMRKGDIDGWGPCPREKKNRDPSGSQR